MEYGECMNCTHQKKGECTKKHVQMCYFTKRCLSFKWRRHTHHWVFTKHFGGRTRAGETFYKCTICDTTGLSTNDRGTITKYGSRR